MGCGVCEETFHRTGSGECIKCVGDDPVVSKVIYSFGLAFFVLLFFVTLFIYLREGGFKMKPKLAACVRCCSSCCKKISGFFKHRCCCCLYSSPKIIDPE